MYLHTNCHKTILSYSSIKLDDAVAGTTIQMSCSSSMHYGELLSENSIEPSKTGNCTNFEDSLCQTNGLLDYSWKPKHDTHVEEAYDMQDDYTAAERMLIHIDYQSPNCLQDNILYYI